MRTDEAVLASLRAVGLSDAGVLGSTGTRRHAERLARGEVTAATLARYATDLATVADTAGGGIPLDFWDVRSPALVAAGLTEYTALALLAWPAYAAYLRLLGQAFARFTALQHAAATDTALATVGDLLRLSAAAVRGGLATPVLAVVPRLTPAGQALFLWQQIVCGTTRWVPVVQRPLFPHSPWSRLNVTTMWQYHARRGMPVAALWGVAGLHPDYVGAPHNTNQIEHLTITAVLQSAFHAPTLGLNLIEVAEAALTPAVPTAERDADIALNRAIAREFVPRFTLAGADAAIDHLQDVLAAPALRWLPAPHVHTGALVLGGLAAAGVVGWAWQRRRG